MKKALSLAMALLMLISMISVVPVMAAVADGSAENPYQVNTPATAPGTITIPAHGAVYYKYKAAIFNGWSVTAYGVTSVVVDGVVFDETNHWGQIEAEFKFKFISPGIVAYVNDTDEELDVTLTHNEPVGSEKNPDELVDGVNSFTIPANNPGYVADYLPKVDGEYTFSTATYEDFTITATVDETVYTMENGSLTLELESYISVRLVISPTGNTGNIDIVVTAPKAGTEDNPIWLSADEVENTYAFSAGDLYFNVDGQLTGNTLVITSVAGAEFTALVDGVDFASEGGVMEVLLDTTEWYIELILTSTVDNEVSFAVEYAAGSEQNPIELVDGDNEIAISEGGYYYYTYTADKDGLLVLTPADAAAFSLLDIAYVDTDGDYCYGYLTEGASSAVLSVPAGQTVIITASGVMDEESGVTGAVNTTMNVAVKELLLHNTFEGADLNGDLEGWSSDTGLVLEEAGEESNVGNGLYSLEFNATLDWANMYRYVNVEKNTNYEVSFKAMAAVAGKELHVKLNDNWGPDVDTAAVAIGTEWAEYSVVVNSGDFETLVLMFQSGTMAADGQTYWLDDIIITKGAASEPEQPEAPAFGVNNGDFETGDTTGWQTHQSVNVTADAAHDGSYGAHLHGNGSWGGIMDQIVPVEAGKSYELSFWIKVNNVGVNLQIKDGDASGASLASGTWYDKNNHADWTLKTYVLTPSTNGIFLNFCGAGGANPNPDAEEDVYVDSIKVRELKAPSFDGYIYNGDFETGDTQSWESVWNSAQISIVDGRNGGSAMQINYPGQWQVVRQKVNVKPHTNYVYGAYTKNCQGAVLLVKSAPADQNINQAGISNSDDWKKHSVEFNSGDCTAVYLCVMSNNPGDSVIVDDFFMFEKKEASNDGYLVNGDFETGDIAPWENLWGSCPKAEVIKGGYNDSFALEIVSGEWKHVRQTNIAVEANTDYKITAWAKNAKDMALLVKDGGDKVDIVNAGVNAGDEWTEFTVTFNSGDYTTIIFSLMGSSADAYGTFDNIVMEKVETACEHEYDDEYDADCNKCGETREVPEKPVEVAYGDLDGDGEINNRDLVAIQQYLNSWEITIDEAAADVNGDGEINNRDLVLLQQYLNSWDVTLGK